MEYIDENFGPSEEFIIFFTRLKFYQFRNEFGDPDEVDLDACAPNATVLGDGVDSKKKLRNDYDNRLKGKNLQMYFLYYEVKRLNKEKKNQFKTIQYLNKQIKDKK